MTVKRSVVEIDVKDSAFKRFAAAFAAYTKALAGAVDDTEKLDAATKKTADKGATQAKRETEAIVGKRRARKAAAAEAEAEERRAEERQKKIAVAKKKQEDAERKAGLQRTKEREHQRKDDAESVKRFKDMAKWTGDIAWNLGKGAVSLAKWAALGALGGGFGLGGLAASASDARRTSQGYGINSGELRAARVNFGAYLDPESTLGNIANAQSDVSKRWIFDAIGERTEGKNAGDILPEILPKLIASFKAGGSTTQGADARGLTQLVGIEDLRRLSALTSDELSKTIESYKRDRESLNVDDATNRDWQQFLISLHRAGQEIEKSLIGGLQPLLPSLREFSRGIGEAIKAFLSNPHLKEWIESFGRGIQRLGAYLGSEEFEQDIGKFLRSIHKVAQWLGKAFDADSDSPAAATAAAASPIKPVGKWQATADVYSAVWDHMTGHVPLSERNHNPGNLRIPGSTTGFQTFANDNEGIRALANQIRLYENRDGLDTISKILRKYSPSNENDTAALIKAASTRTGLGADQKLDPKDIDQLVKIVLAITKQENGRSNFTAQGIKIAIDNTTGGNVNTTVAAMNGAH